MASTDQEIFWQGNFGNEYTNRNISNQEISSNINLFSKILSNTSGVDSALELGCNRGMNLIALHKLNPEMSLSGVEINAKAVELSSKLDIANITQGSLLDYSNKTQVDLTFTKGVLIHINPDKLTDAYQALYSNSRKYILVVEYYNPEPVTIQYRGHGEKLFKRDFAGELMDKYSDLKLINYGFTYRRDPVFPLDDSCWFLMKKS